MKQINTKSDAFASKKINVFIVFIFLMVLSVNLFSQTSGKLVGKVTDQSGEPLIGANVILDGTTIGAATDVEGYYSIINVRAGSYQIRFRFLGYKTLVVENIRISADQTTKLDAVLESEIIEGEEVVIIAQKPLVEYNQTSSVSSVNKDDIKNLPVQSLSEIVNLQAGVIDGHFRGGRIGEVQYQVDGVTVNNPFSNSSMLDIDRSVIEEVQVISGTFDAKYGQAMSGVVNTVLKTGSDKFEYSLETYLGDYFTTDTDRYPHNDSYSPTTIQNYQLSISGPMGLPQTTFFVNGRKYLNSGYLFGTRRFTPFDKNDFAIQIFNPTGDNELVSMNTSDEWNGQFKITNQSIDDLQFNYQLAYNYAERTGYNHAFRLNPDGIKTNYTTSLSHGLAITHTLSPEMFYKINIRQNLFEYDDYKYEDLMDPRYLEAGKPESGTNYEDGAIVQGVDLDRYKQKTNSLILKADYTWQANRFNMIEAGANIVDNDIVLSGIKLAKETADQVNEQILVLIKIGRLPTNRC